MKKCYMVLKLVVLLFAIQPMIARATYSCSGPVSGVTLNGNGLVTVQSIAGFSWVYLCNLDTTYNGFTPTACRATYTMLLTAQLTQQHVMFWFADDGNCSTSVHQPWGPLSGHYLGPNLMP
jgi:hypothetical protein